MDKTNFDILQDADEIVEKCEERLKQKHFIINQLMRRHLDDKPHRKFLESLFDNECSVLVYGEEYSLEFHQVVDSELELTFFDMHEGNMHFYLSKYEVDLSDKEFAKYIEGNFKDLMLKIIRKFTADNSKDEQTKLKKKHEREIKTLKKLIAKHADFAIEFIEKTNQEKSSE